MVNASIPTKSTWPIKNQCRSFYQNCFPTLIVFSHIPIFSYNVQILHILKSPNDAWTRMIRKLASDVVHRIFHSFGNEEISAKNRLTKELFLQCFEDGQSTSRKIKGITNWGDTHVGREILVKNSQGENEKFSTSHLFVKPNPVLIRNKQCFSSAEDHKSPEFLYRHYFEHELDLSAQLIDSDLTNAFMKIDQRENLLEMKATIEKDLALKFMSSDDRIILAMREVLIAEFDKTISSSFEKTDKKIDNVSEKVENVGEQVEQINQGQENMQQNMQQIAQGQDDMLHRIYMRLKRLEGSPEDERD